MATAHKPSAKQLTYLKSLADRTGQTFSYPHTSRDASREIDRLKHTRPSSRSERHVERKLIADQIQAGPIDAARVRAHEISGHGSSATWTQNHRAHPPAPSTTATVARRSAPAVGPRTELARYHVPSGTRILYGQRVDGIVRVTDNPAGGHGRAYLVERELETKAELDALIADYLASAERLQAVPMGESPIDRYLDGLIA